MLIEKDPLEKTDLPAREKADDRSPPLVGAIIRAKDIRAFTGIPDSTRADWENPKSPRYDPTFPKKIRLGARTTGYLREEVLAWLKSRRQA